MYVNITDNFKTLYKIAHQKFLDMPVFYGKHSENYVRALKYMIWSFNTEQEDCKGQAYYTEETSFRRTRKTNLTIISLELQKKMTHQVSLDA